MSITVMENGRVKGGCGYMNINMGGMSCVSSIIESPPELIQGGDRIPMAGDVKVIKEEEREDDGALDSCSCSSIGKNSDDDIDSEEGEEEVQSSYNKYKYKYNGRPSTLDAIQSLEEALPIRRGISRFYNGKSMSFTSLGDASSSSSMKDLAKPENAYTRKRRNLVACSLVWDKNRSFQLRSNGGGISKRLLPNNSSGTTLALAVAMTNSGSNDSNSSPNRSSTSPPQHRLAHCNGSSSSTSSSPRRNLSAWRSFSVADLQQCASLTAATCTPVIETNFTLPL